MSNNSFKRDDSFSRACHTYLGLPFAIEKFGFCVPDTPIMLSLLSVTKKLDMQDAIDGFLYRHINMNLSEDYYTKDGVIPKGTLTSVLMPYSTQFRYRTYSTYPSNSITIRYERPNSKLDSAHASEWYKLNYVDLFYYNETNCTRENIAEKIQNKTAAITKSCILDMTVFNKDVNEGKIRPDVNNMYTTFGNIRKSVYKDGILWLPIIENKDKSSTFVSIDAATLNKLNSNIIRFNYNFKLN